MPATPEHSIGRALPNTILRQAETPGCQVPGRHPTLPFVSTLERESHLLHTNDLQEQARRWFGQPAERIEALRGDASRRAIYRLHYGSRTAIGIVGPHRAENLAFIGFTQTFLALSLPVPELYTVSDNQHVYLMEDLGDTTLAEYLQGCRDSSDRLNREAVLPALQQVVHDLVRFQVEAADRIDYTLCYQHDSFDERTWLDDQQTFLDHFVRRFLPGSIDEETLADDLKRHRKRLAQPDRSYFLYRDFQPRNIMVTPDGLRYIDYQSGRRGSVLYDIVSFAYSSSSRLDRTLRNEMIELHLHTMAQRTSQTTDHLREHVQAFALIRLLQALGSYGRNGIAEGKPRFLRSIPTGLQNALHVLDQDPQLKQLHALRDTLEAILEARAWEPYLSNPDS
ncbi:phosphotransferase [bacterium]|nr:phosphotransferase [bacterium]